MPRFDTSPRQSSSRFGGNFFVTVLGEMGGLGFGIISSLLSARLLGPQGRGELAAITLWPTFLVFLFSMGNTQAIVFHTGKQRFDISEVWTSALVIGLVLSAAAVLTGLWVIPVALSRFSPHAQNLALLLVAAAPLLWFTGVPTSLLQGKLDIGYFNLLRLICPAIYAGGLFLLLVLHRPYLHDAVMLQVIGFVCMDIYGFWLVFRRLKPQWKWNSRAGHSLLSFGWKTQLGNMASYVNQRLDQLLLTLFVPVSDLGFYVVAVSVTSALSFLPRAAGEVTLAFGSSLGPEQAKRVIAKSFGVTLLALVAGGAALYFICPWLIPVAFGARFVPAVLPCRILLPGAVALGLNQVLFNGARALDHPALPSYAEGFAAAVTCVALYLLLPRYGFIGAAIASSLAYVTSLLFSVALFYFHEDIKPYELIGEYPLFVLRRINTLLS